MSLRAGHGNGAGVPRIEVMPADELPRPVPVPVPEPAGPIARRQDGRFADSASAKEAARRGGLAKARQVRLVDSLGLSKLTEDSAFGPYRTSAEAFVAHHLGELAKSAGGEVGPAPSTMVSSAALQLAGSRYCFDEFAKTSQASWMKLGSQLANDSRQNLLAAYEIATREAASRVKDWDPIPLLSDDDDEPSVPPKPPAVTDPLTSYRIASDDAGDPDEAS